MPCQTAVELNTKSLEPANVGMGMMGALGNGKDK